MIKYIFKRFFRQPLYNITIILFVTLLSVVICYLNHIKVEEQRSFEESYASIPVFFKVTDLDGSSVKEVDGIDGWIADLFSDSGLYNTLSPYVLELHVRVSYDDKAMQEYTYIHEKYGQMIAYKDVLVTGITSTRVAEELTEGLGGKIHWNEGYDENILKSDEFVCLVPESLKGSKEEEIIFEYVIETDGNPIIRTEKKKFKVVGYYTDQGNSRYYIPYLTMEWIYAKLGRSKEIEGIGAILNDNNNLDGLRETAKNWFAEPNSTGKKDYWGKFGYEYYLYALDIDDEMLNNLSLEMKNSMRINRLSSALVFILSACSGFLTGFLIIRSRKREIFLMMMLGSSNKTIFINFEVEQMICIICGLILGGSYTLWNPIGKLFLFGFIYVIGLTVALFIFIKANLLVILKEDE